MNKKTILLIGRRKALLRKLASALDEAGYPAEWTNDMENSSQKFDGSRFSLVAFGRGVSEVNKQVQKKNFSHQNQVMLFVDGLAPIIPLLVDQVNNCFYQHSGKTKPVSAARVESGDKLVLYISLSENSEVEVRIYILDFLFRSHEHHLLKKSFLKGDHRLEVDQSSISRQRRKFIVVKANNDVICVQPLLTIK